ncbi:serpin family protein [Calothrix sp. PCC 6303]|uniref:serpin family protein n=1 Tax=Calothrix sp. PCC 6303 TaxID=1170562 RepID=UPI0002A01205|nr:serpin family protein [Calothrix sp. PCC 6303]AFZ00118.1 proteinase inhibitor I4 serpin [Calothrix sp. PCC 6303]
MKQKFSQAGENFRQRRYGVSLGRRYALAATSVVLMGVLGCSQLNSGSGAFAESRLPNSELPIPKPNMNLDPKLVAANTKFGFKLFSEINQENKEENIFISPSSVAIALAMTYNGAQGKTQQAMVKALELQGLNLQQINSSNAALKSLLENPDTQVQLTIANSLWANQQVAFKADFLQRNRDFYKAVVSNIDFSSADTLDIINGWVRENTKGKIEKIVDAIDPNQAMFLINAIYFKGSWTNAFDAKQTTESQFYLASGQAKKHPLMSQKGEYKYLETDEFQAVSLPYGKDGKVSFYAFLPKEKSNLQTFAQTLNAENWEKWMNQFSTRDGSVSLPRFKMDYEIDLKDSLVTLGMGEAFGNKADFSGIGKNLAISEVKHKTFVEVNEEGTEAAAVTSVGIRATSAIIKPEPFEMVINRPFFTCIRDNQTGSILFMGSIVDPS